MERTQEQKQLRNILRNLPTKEFNPVPKIRRFAAGKNIKGDDFYAMPGIELDRKIIRANEGYRGKLLIGWKDGSVCQLEVCGQYVGDTVEEYRTGRECEPGLWDFNHAYIRLAEMSLQAAA